MNLTEYTKQMNNFEAIKNTSLGQLCAFFLVHSYLYYNVNMSLLDDAVFDYLCRRLYENFEQFEHMHKHLLDKEALQAGTGFYLKTKDYPRIVRSIAGQLIGGE